MAKLPWNFSSWQGTALNGLQSYTVSPFSFMTVLNQPEMHYKVQGSTNCCTRPAVRVSLVCLGTWKIRDVPVPLLNHVNKTPLEMSPWSYCCLWPNMDWQVSHTHLIWCTRAEFFVASRWLWGSVILYWWSCWKGNISVDSLMDHKNIDVKLYCHRGIFQFSNRESAWMDHHFLLVFTRNS